VKNTLIVGGVVAVLGLVVWLVMWVVLPGAVPGEVGPDPATANDAEIQAFLDSEAFRALSQEDRAGYLRRLRESGGSGFRVMRKLSSKGRKAVRETMRPEMNSEMDKFFRMSETEQLAYLDRRIDDMQQMRERFRERREAEKKDGDEKTEERPRRGPPWMRDGNFDPDEAQRRREKRLSEHPPKERAQRSEFFRRLRERMRQRYPDRTFGRGGGRGRS